jgi:hypothetical protein
MDKYWSKWIDPVMEVLGWFSKEELERQYQETVTEFDEDALAAVRNRVAA